MQFIFIKIPFKMIPKWGMLPMFILFLSLSGQAQNINIPNKVGPMGIQVNTLTGNLFMSRNDIYIPGRGFDIDISFKYNSFHAHRNIGFGNGWSFSYNIKYRNDPAAKVIVWGDGREDSYDSLGSGSFKAPRGFFTAFSEYQAGRFLITEPDGTKYFFDNSTHKKITKMEDPNGNSLTFNYTDTLLTTISNAAGQVISLGYSNGRLATVTDAINSPARTFTYSYDGAGNLTQVIDPLNNTENFTYLVNGPMKTISDKNNNIVDIIYFTNFSVSELIGCNRRLSFSYDSATLTSLATDHLSQGEAQQTKYEYKKQEGRTWLSGISGNCCGFNMSFEFDAQGNKIKETDANGNIYAYTYDNRGNLLTMTDPLGQVETYTYSSDFNKITSFTDKKGSVTTMNYDSKGNLTQLVEPGNHVYLATYNSNGDIISTTNPRGIVFNYSYDSYGNLISVTGPHGSNINLSFDAWGRLLTHSDARNNSSSMEYDILNRLKKITDPLDNITQLSYDAEGNMISMINQNNEQNEVSYDASNRPVKYTDVVGNEFHMTYDDMDNLIALTNELDQKMSFEYNKLNRIVAMTDARGNKTNYSYDGNGNIIALTLPNGQALNVQYDNLNRMLSASDITGSILNMSYDENNNVASFKNGTGAITTAEYDNNDRIRKLVDPLGNSISIEYDENSNLLSFTDRNGNTESFTYDSLNRVKTLTDKNGNVINVTYDAVGNILSSRDQNNNITNYEYDGLDRLTRTTFPDGLYMEFTYDGESNLIARRNTDGSNIFYTYDSLDRVVTKNVGGHIHNYTYDALGRITTATNNSGTISFTYDDLNRVRSESFDGKTVNYDYNVAGRTQTTVYPDGVTVVKNYDTRHRLTSIVRNGITIVSYEYNNANQVITKTFFNGVVTSYQYDFANRLNSIATANGSIQNTLFTYDKERNKSSINRLNDPSQSEQFGYDDGYRLVDYKRGVIGGTPTIQNIYTFDAVGNRSSTNTNGVNTLYSINNLNQLTGSNNGTQNITFTYDARGNLSFDGVFHKMYDAENRLIKDSSSALNVITYAYDAYGRRIQKIQNGTVLNYTFSGFSPIEERNGLTNSVINSTVFSSYLTPVLNEKNSNSYFYHQNELNSVEAITNSSGSLVERWQYDVYGKPTIFNGAGVQLAGSIAGNRFGFTGQEFDSATGEYRFFFRTYSPSTGSFGQRDPIGYADGMGMYQYVDNNPSNFTDTYGLAGGPANGDCPPHGHGHSMAETVLHWLHAGNHVTEMVVESIIESKESRITELFKSWQGENATWKALKGNSSPQQIRDAIEGVRKNNGWIRNTIEGIRHGSEKLHGAANALGKLGTGMNVLNVGGKGTAFLSSAYNNGVTSLNTVQAGGDLGQAAMNFNPAGAVFNLLDFATGKFIINPLTGEHTSGVVDFIKQTQDKSQQIKYDRIVSESEHELFMLYANQGPDKLVQYLLVKEKMEKKKHPCPPHGPSHGTQDPHGHPPGQTASSHGIRSDDPNEIIGPDGVPDKAWVSVNDRLPYTVLFENSLSAGAPAKFVRIVAPVHEKMDASSFQLGSFGFNSLTFTVPPVTASYYTRLDCRDSLGLYVDITAGYDQINNRAFWEFQSIDPVTLLPPSDPFAGFLLLQDSTDITSGHGFVNFSIKPKPTAQTLDSIIAEAEIIFDANEMIPTNREKNTVDALAPTSHLNNLPGNTVGAINLSWSGIDDLNGCGLHYYTLYVSNDGINFSIVRSGITRTDTSYTAAAGSMYYFFVLATDSVGNTEALRPGEVKSIFVGGAVLPVTWLYFKGKTENKDNILEWSVTNEQNSREYQVERSLNGIDFTTIGTVASNNNAASANTYQYTDRRIDRLNSAVMYYRLRQVDHDNTTRYSSVVRLTYKEKLQVKSIVYPNPTKGHISVLIGDRKLIGTMALVYDIAGRQLQQVKVSSDTQQFDLTRYLAGVYFIRLENKEVLQVIKE